MINTNVDSGLLAWPSAAVKQILVTSSTTVVIGNAQHQQAAGSTIAMPRQVYKEELLLLQYATTQLVSKGVPKGLCATEGGEGNINQDGGGHNIIDSKVSVSVGNNDHDRQVRHNFYSPRHQLNKPMVVTYLVKKFRKENK